jgi:hypothetical protein
MSWLTQVQQEEQLRREALAAIEEGPGDDPELCDCTPDQPKDGDGTTEGDSE